MSTVMTDLDGKKILITGSTDGLGKQVAADVASMGATVLVHGRDEEKGEAVIEELKAASGSDRFEFYLADFARLDDVRRMADRIEVDHDRLDVLINNAGIGFGAPGTGRQTSEDGLELRFQVNYLAGFLLTQRLLPLIRAAGEARIVHVASAAQQPIDFDDVMLERQYSGNRAYSQSKLAQIMYTKELSDRLDTGSVTANALHPATYMDTNMVVEAGIRPANSVRKGADAVLHLVASDEVADVSGRYFDGKRPSRPQSQAEDAEARRRLWELSERLTDGESGGES